MLPPDLDNQSTDVERQSTLSFTRDCPPYHLDSAKPHHSSQSDVYRLGNHLPTDTSARIVDSPVRYTHRSEEPWLAGLSGHHIPPQQLTTQGVPRISDLVALPRIRGCDSTEQPRRTLGEQRSYTALSPSLATTGHPHFTIGTNNSGLARVKHEPDTDSSIPLPRPSWVYDTAHLPSVHRSVSVMNIPTVSPY